GDKPHAGAAAPDSAARSPEFADSRRTRRAAALRSHARVRSWTAGQSACPAERALENQRRCSTVRAEGVGPSDGQPLPTVLATARSILRLYTMPRAIHSCG